MLRLRTRYFSLLLGGVFFLSVSKPAIGALGKIGDDLSTWAGAQEKSSIERMLFNISPPGTVLGVVVASPSQHNPNYYYHWIRDAALVMGVVVDLYLRATNAETKKYIHERLIDYISFSRTNQLTPNMSGGLGEPKFLVDGSAYLEPWGRPQNDGPALRAITLVRLAEIWLEEGKEELVRKVLYRPEFPANTVIKSDLEFVSHHWWDKSYDIWEEVSGHQFYTRLVQRRSLLEGALLAERLGDGVASYWYRKQAGLLEEQIAKHSANLRGLIVPTLERNSGIDYKYSDLDSSVILAILHAVGDDGYFPVTDDRVIQTALKLQDSFQKLYPINNKGYRGTVIGRYPEDRYNGYSTGQEGNPWLITTQAFAELYYRMARAFERSGEFALTRVRCDLLESVGIFGSKKGEKLYASDPKFKAVIKALLNQGDHFLGRTQTHGYPDGGLSEQVNRYSGYMQGARDLTWSHSSFLTAIWARY